MTFEMRKKDFRNIFIVWVLICVFFVSMMYVYQKHSAGWIQRIEYRDPYLHLKQGKAFLAEGKLAEAKNEFETAIRFDKNMASAHFFLGDVFDRENKSDIALQHYIKAITLDDTIVNYPYRLGYVYNKRGEYKRAIKYFEKAMNLKGNLEIHAKSHLMIARAKVSLEDYVGGIYYYEEYLKLNRSDIKVLRTLADIYFDQTFYKKAKAKYMEYLAVDRGNQEVIKRVRVCEENLVANQDISTLLE